VQGSNLRPAD